jgi:hypothetical protein
MGDLVEQPQRDDLAGMRRRRATTAFVEPGGQPAGGGVLVDEQFAVVTEVPPIEVIPAS